MNLSTKGTIFDGNWNYHQLEVLAMHPDAQCTLLFRIQSPPNSTISFNLRSGTFILGRSSVCDFIVKDASVSRRHAEITVKDDRVIVRDLNSHNGTFVEDRRITTTTVLPGTQLRFGAVTVFLSSPESPHSHSGSDDVETDPVRDGIESNDLQVARRHLSEAQRRVFDLLLHGLSEKEIGRRLHLSWRTVHNHAFQIHRILDVHSGTELLARFLPGNGTTEAHK